MILRQTPTRHEVDVMPDEKQPLHPSGSVDSLAHDLRHALYALRTGIQILPQIRENAAEFNEIHRLLMKEVENASRLTNRLLKERPVSD